MSLAETGKAIGKVTELLVNRLGSGTGLNILAGRPEPASGGSRSDTLNLFLYDVEFDHTLRNQPLDEGQVPPLWLILKYLMTAFDEKGNSDTAQAHEYLGEGLRALQENSLLQLTDSLPADTLAALQDNPEVLKITFGEAGPDLLSKLMQGTDEKYRFSVGFQVRPVMISTGEPPSHSLLVGVDYTMTPHGIVGEKGIQIPILPSLGPVLAQVVPSWVEGGGTLTIKGADLDLQGLSVKLGEVMLPVTAQRADRLECLVANDLGGVTSAGSHPLRVVQALSNGRSRPSNLLVVGLLPTLEKAVLTDDSVELHEVRSDGTRMVYGKLNLTGFLLGTDNDDVSLSLYRNGVVARAFDEFSHSPAQTSLTLSMTSDQSVPEGTYRTILRVNGQQARSSPEVDIVVSP
jgi:hypothetical protein